MVRVRKDANKKTGFILYFSIALSLIFISNIFMHMIAITDKEGAYHEMALHYTKGYEVEGNQYLQLDKDPQLYFTCEPDDIHSIRIDFAEALKSDTMIEIYYPDEYGNYAEQRSRKHSLQSGENEVEIDIESGQYAEMRIDINGDFSLHKVYQNSMFTCMAYAQKSIRYVVWGICLLSSFIITISLLHKKKLRERIEMKYLFVKHQIFSRDNYILLCLVCISCLIGFIVEVIKALCVGSPFNEREILVFSGVIFVISSFFCMRRYYQIKIEKMTFILLMVCGIIYALVLPVSLGISWDDETHYKRTINSARYLNHTMTSAEWGFGQDYVNAFTDPGKLTKERQEMNRKHWDDLYQIGGIKKNEDFQLSMKDIGYWPAILGVWVSYGLCLSFSHGIILIRIVNILFVAIMIYLSMKNVKSGKLLIAALALLPTVFYLASNFSYDTWLIVLLLYGFSRYFGELQCREQKLTWKNFLGIFIPLFLALPPKLVYAPLLFLTAYMPERKFKEKKWCLAYRSCFLMAAFVVVTAVLYAVGGNIDLGIGDIRGGEGVNANAQFEYICRNFGAFMVTLTNFLKYYFSYPASRDYLTFMAYLGQSGLQMIAIFILGFVALTERSDTDQKLFPLLLKISSIVMYILIGALCATAMYISFTPVGADTVGGCQGRYIIPAIFPVLFIVSRFGKWNLVRKKCPAEYYNFVVLGFSVFFLLYHLWLNCAVKYC